MAARPSLRCVARRWLRHSSIAVTQRYAHMTTDALHGVLRPQKIEVRLRVIEVSRIRKAEPPSGIEPPTYGLRNRCSTPELRWRKSAVS